MTITFWHHRLRLGRSTAAITAAGTIGYYRLTADANRCDYRLSVLWVAATDCRTQLDKSFD